MAEAPHHNRTGAGQTASSQMCFELRNKFFQHILDNKLHFEFLRHVELQNPEVPFDRQSVDMFPSFVSNFLENHECIADWTVRPHQPMNLNIMSQLNFVMHDHDIDLFPSLMEGISTEFNNYPTFKCLWSKRSTETSRNLTFRAPGKLAISRDGT